MIDTALITARVAGRTAANELADLYVTESARMNQEHGQEASIVFFETLRDNLIAIRPLPEKPAQPEYKRTGSTTERLVNRERKNWEEETPDRFVIVAFGDDVKNATDRAVLIGSLWIPKSQIADGLNIGDFVEEWVVTKWFADKEDLEYEE